MRLTADLQEYAENIWRRFPEVFVSLGAACVDDAFGAEDGQYWHRIVDTSAKRVVQIVLPRRGVTLAGQDPFAFDIEDVTQAPDQEVGAGNAGQGHPDKAEETHTPPSSVTSSLAERRGICIIPVNTRCRKEFNEAQRVVRAKHLDRRVSHDSLGASALTPKSSGSAPSLPMEERCSRQASSGQYMDDHYEHWSTWGGTGDCPEYSEHSGSCYGSYCCGGAPGGCLICDRGGSGFTGQTEDYGHQVSLDEESPGTKLQQAAARKRAVQQQQQRWQPPPLRQHFVQGQGIQQDESPGALVQRIAAMRRVAQASRALLKQAGARPSTL